MEKYTIEQRLKVIQAYYENGRSNQNTYRTLRDFFGQFNRPNVRTIGKIVQKFEQTGSVGDVKTPVHARTARTAENIAAVRDSMVEEPSTSTRRRAQQLHLSRSSLMNIMHKDLHLHAYKAQPIRVVVTGAAGQIAYSLLYMIARGEVFGKDQPLILHLLDIPPMMGVLEGVVMELADCALPLLRQVIPTADPAEGFKDVAAAFLVGAMPRKEGMERKDLLSANVKIFKAQGQAIDQHARKDIKVLVVGNPANTNALVCSHYAPSIPRENFTAMTRLDQNRASAQIAAKLGLPINAVKNVVIWGNHSSTQFPDPSNGVVEVGGSSKRVWDAVNDAAFLQGQFVETVQKRGAAVIAARKMSSAMSAAKAACDHMHDWWNGTAPGQFVSMGVISDGSYGAPKDVVFSFPVEISDGKWKIVQGLQLDDFAKSKLAITGKELEEEKGEAMAVCSAD